MAKQITGSVLTGNDLRSGRIVYWSADNSWRQDFDRALIATNEAQLAQLSRKADDLTTQLEVVGAYVVGLGEGSSPVKLREDRRLRGALAA